MNEIIRFGQSLFSLEVEMNVESELANVCFVIEVGSDEKNPGLLRLITEELTVTYRHSGEHNVYEPSHQPHSEDSAELQFQPYVEDEGEPGLHRPFRARRDRPALTQIMQEHNNIAPAFEHLPKKVAGLFVNMRFLELSPERLREPAFPGATVLGDSGDKLASGVARNLRRPQTPGDSGELDCRADPDGCDGLRVSRRSQRPCPSHAVARPTAERYRPIAPRTVRCVFSPCSLCCSARIRRACISLRRSTPAFTRRGSGFCLN